jgi:hypothetical protein
MDWLAARAQLQASCDGVPVRECLDDLPLAKRARRLLDRMIQKLVAALNVSFKVLPAGKVVAHPMPIPATGQKEPTPVPVEAGVSGK